MVASAKSEICGSGAIFSMHDSRFLTPGRNEGELLLGEAVDVALRQRLFQFGNLCLGEVGVVIEKELRWLLDGYVFWG